MDKLSLSREKGENETERAGREEGERNEKGEEEGRESCKLFKRLNIESSRELEEYAESVSTAKRVAEELDLSLSPSLEHIEKLLSCLSVMFEHQRDYKAVVLTEEERDEDGEEEREREREREREELYHRPSDFVLGGKCCRERGREKGSFYLHGDYISPSLQAHRDREEERERLGERGDKEVTLCISLMNPAVVLDPIAESVHSLILSSGTLFPMHV